MIGGMKLWWGALLLLGSFTNEPKSLLWETTLEKHRLQSFDRNIRVPWMNSQGVLFLTPERILIYQVNRTAERARLAPRGSSGGAGNFFLDVRILQAQDGRIIKSMDLPTNARASDVMATRNGGFLVRAGTVLYLYTADFQQTAAKALPLERVAPSEGWQMRVSPSGTKVVLMHEQVFARPELLADNTVLHDGRAQVDVQILDADSIAAEATFSLAHALAFWAPGEGVLFSSNPAHSYSDGQVGTLGFDGRWTPIRAGMQEENNFCHHGVDAIDSQRLVLFGCEEFAVFSAEGRRIFSVKDSHSVFKSAIAAGGYLAVLCDRYRADGTPGGNWRPDRIEVFNLDSHSKILSVPVHTEGVSYAVSPQGALAVIDGEKLRVYEVEKESAVSP
jgi:hypothetical protein